MALYINGRPVNPIVQFLVSAVVLAAVVGIGILLLPVIGGILLFVLICVAALALYGVYWRWRHGDPLENLRKRMQEEMRAQEDAEDRVAEARAPEEGLKPRASCGKFCAPPFLRFKKRRLTLQQHDGRFGRIFLD